MTAAASNQKPAARRARWLPLAIFVLVFALHAFYLRHEARLPAQGWADAGIVDDRHWGFEPYLQARDYFTGFSYALAATFGTWAVAQFIRQRRAALAAGAVGSVSLVAVLVAGGCFLIGCCGSPMLAVYLSLFGAKALGAGKPLMALVTLLSTGCGYYCLSPRFRKRGSRAGAEACGSGSICGCADSMVKAGQCIDTVACATGNACGCGSQEKDDEPRETSSHAQVRIK